MPHAGMFYFFDEVTHEGHSVLCFTGSQWKNECIYHATHCDAAHNIAIKPDHKLNA